MPSWQLEQTCNTFVLIWNIFCINLYLDFKFLMYILTIITTLQVGPCIFTVGSNSTAQLRIESKLICQPRVSLFDMLGAFFMQWL